MSRPEVGRLEMERVGMEIKDGERRDVQRLEMERVGM